MKLHIDYCKSFGIEVDEIEATEEHQGMEPSRALDAADPDRQTVRYTYRVMI